MLIPILRRWGWLLPAAKALGWWSEFAHRSRRIKDLFALAFRSNQGMVLDRAWGAWEELLQEKRARELMSKVIEMLQGTALRDALNEWRLLAVGGPRWQMMLAVHKQHEAVLVRKMLRSWLYVALHDRSRVLLPMFLARRQHGLLLRTMRAWGPSQAQGAG